MVDGEERQTPGFCGKCNKETVTLWKRAGYALKISCTECGLCYARFEYRFRPEEEEKKLKAANKKVWDKRHNQGNDSKDSEDGD